MKMPVASVLLASAFVGPALASPPAPSEDAAAVATIKQIEQDMGDAMVAADIDKLGQFFADDFGFSGKPVTKETLLQNFKSGKDKLESFELGPMNVQVFGNIATVIGSSTEKRTRDGKDISGKFVWMDILEKREGKWVVVRDVAREIK